MIYKIGRHALFFTNLIGQVIEYLLDQTGEFIFFITKWIIIAYIFVKIWGITDP